MKPLKFLSKVNFYAIFCDIMHIFMMACGITFLIMFFNYESFELLSKEVLLRGTRNFVHIFYWTMFICRCVLVLTSGDRRWVHETENTPDCASAPAQTEMISEVNEDEKALSEYNKKVFAIHEAGHGAMAYLQKLKTFNVYLSHITPRVVTVDKIATAEDVRKRILIKYSGAAAEELMLGKIHAGCAGSDDADFNSATELIKQYIVMTDPSVSKTLLNEELSDKTITLSKVLYQEAKDLLSQNRKILELIADELMHTNNLSRDDIEKLLNKPARTTKLN